MSRQPLSPIAAACVAVLLITSDRACDAAPQPPGHSQGGLRYTVVVADFENHSNWRGQFELGHELGLVLTAVLQESQNFIVLAENELREMSMGEQDLVASGRAASGNNAPATGHLAAAQLIVRGAITHVQGGGATDTGGVNLGHGLRVRMGREKTEINVTFYMLDSSTGQVVASKSVIADSSKFRFGVQKQVAGRTGEYAMDRSNNLMKALMEAAQEAVVWMNGQLQHLTWQGQVVLVNNDKVYINRGSREGVRPGQELVTGSLTVIRDPTTGEVLDQFLDSTVATLKVETVNEKSSVCAVLSGDVRRVRERLTVLLASGR